MEHNNVNSPLINPLPPIILVITLLIVAVEIIFQIVEINLLSGFSNEINRGALLLVSDTPMIPEGIKTEEKDKDVTQKYVDLHIDMGIEAMTKIGDEGEKIKHFKY